MFLQLELLLYNFIFILLILQRSDYSCVRFILVYFLLWILKNKLFISSYSSEYNLLSTGLEMFMEKV